MQNFIHNQKTEKENIISKIPTFSPILIQDNEKMINPLKKKNINIDKILIKFFMNSSEFLKKAREKNPENLFLFRKKLENKMKS